MSEYQIPLYELIIDEEDEMGGVYTIGLVSSPAIEANWVTLSKQHLQLKAIDEKRILVGPALIPNKKIYRVNELGEEFYVTFSNETIEKIVKKYFKQSRHVNFNMEHVENLTVNAVVQESWIIEDTKFDKSLLYGFELPKGTWMLATYIEDEEMWENYVKTGKLKGYSIEGMFAQELIKASTNLIAEPQAGETKDEFISRCIAIEVEGGYDQEQASAICYSKWEDTKMSKGNLSVAEAIEIITDMVKRYK